MSSSQARRIPGPVGASTRITSRIRSNRSWLIVFLIALLPSLIVAAHANDMAERLSRRLRIDVLLEIEGPLRRERRDAVEARNVPLRLRRRVANVEHAIGRFDRRAHTSIEEASSVGIEVVAPSDPRHGQRNVLDAVDVFIAAHLAFLLGSGADVRPRTYGLWGSIDPATSSASGAHRPRERR